MHTEETTLLTTESPDAVLACILDMGELLLTGGGEVFRVEDTLGRLCAAYGFQKINVFSITSSIVLTAECPDGKILTQTRRIITRGTDLQRVAQVNALSRQLCVKPVSVEEFQKKLEEIQKEKTYPRPIMAIGYALISAVFAVFFGGSWLDGLAAAISGLVVFFAQQAIARLRMNNLLENLLVSAFTALAVVLLVRLGIGHSPAKITIGNIMLLIPGISFTTSLRDIINGDTISGLIGISEAAIKAIAIAIGFALMLVQMGGVL